MAHGQSEFLDIRGSLLGPTLQWRPVVEVNLEAPGPDGVIVLCLVGAEGDLKFVGVRKDSVSVHFNRLFEFRRRFKSNWSFLGKDLCIKSGFGF